MNAPAYCRICGSPTRTFFTGSGTRLRLYHRCLSCAYIGLDPRFFPSRSDEKARYLLHMNEESPGYLDYLDRFLASAVLPFADPLLPALDFGSGPNPDPLLPLLLGRKGISCDVYDPFFARTRKWKRKRYGTLIIHEVAEHLRNPREIFSRFPGILTDGAVIAVRTRFPPDGDAEFSNWWYRSDATHLGFFSPESLERLFKYIGCEAFFRLEPDMMTARYKSQS